jgi:dUTP pyrophosphatase
MNTWYELEILPLTTATPYMGEVDRSPENAGFDLYSMQNVDVVLKPEFIPFGIAARLIKVDDSGATDVHFWLAPRSSIYKTGLIMANSIGVIDSSYRGELKAPVWSITHCSKVNTGDRLFQIVAPDMGWIRHVRIVNELPPSTRGTGGFGSTGLN